jgi:2Fe-2S ferredoxin
MPSVTYIQPDGTPRTVEVPNASTVMMGAIRNSVIGIEAECGGACSCATCHVYVDAAWVDKLPPPDADELDMLDGVVAEHRPESRLSCQIKITPEIAGLVVRLPDRQV